MMDKRLISSVEESKRYIAGNVVAQWVCLIANITMIAALARLFGTLFQKKANTDAIAVTALIMAAAAILRFFMLRLSAKMSFLSAREVKKAAQHDLSKAAGVGRFLSGTGSNV